MQYNGRKIITARWFREIFRYPSRQISCTQRSLTNIFISIPRLLH